MRAFTYLSILSVIISVSCGSDDQVPAATGSFEIEFDNVVGNKQIDLAEDGVTEYPYTNSLGQTFNLVVLRYYVSKIKLSGPNGEVYEEVQKVGPEPADIKGIYLIQESKPDTRKVKIENVPAGTYNKVTFTVGIDSAGVEQGAAGGILDPAGDDTWFWNWNAGYVSFGLEGQSPNSGGPDKSARSLRADNHAGIAFHIGGWKQVPGSMFVYNNKEITLDFGVDITVSEKLSPQLHLVMDVLKVLDGVDFSQTHAVHSPMAGTAIANNIEKAFAVDHVHQ